MVLFKHSVQMTPFLKEKKMNSYNIYDNLKFLGVTNKNKDNYIDW